jgi:hypothetical protein
MMQIKGEILSVECGHTFHRRCLKRWFSKSNTCPLCRDPSRCSDAIAGMEKRAQIAQEKEARLRKRRQLREARLRRQREERAAKEWQKEMDKRHKAWEKLERAKEKARERAWDKEQMRRLREMQKEDRKKMRMT